MSEDEKEIKIPVIRELVRFSKKIKLPGMGGEFSLYHLLDIYGTGILKGSFSPRASSIAYSFFLALFPFLLLLLNLIPYIPVDGFQTRFLIFMEALLPAQTTQFGQAQAGFCNCMGKICVFGRIHDINAAGLNCDCAGGQGRVMGGSVNTASKPRHHNISRIAQITGQGFRHPRAER